MAFGLVLIGWATFSSLMSIYVQPYWLIPIWIVLGALVGFIFMLLVTLILIYAVIVPTKVTNKFKAYYTKSLCWFANNILMGIRIKVYGLDNIKHLKQVILYTNHKSKTDPQILIKSVPGPVAFTPKKELFSVPFLGSYLKALGCMVIDRDSNRETVKQLSKTINDIKKGLSLIVHPEGGICTREVETMVDMRPGAYKFAIKTGVPIVPVAIIGSSLICKKFPFFVTKKVQVHFLQPLLKEEYEKMDTTQIAKYVFDEVNKKVEEINGVHPLPENIKHFN